MDPFERMWSFSIFHLVGGVHVLYFLGDPRGLHTFASIFFVLHEIVEPSFSKQTLCKRAYSCSQAQGLYTTFNRLVFIAHVAFFECISLQSFLYSKFNIAGA